ncbi:hypothetical protein HYT59_02525 [Candidatus Woesebacteria bacterium]|nr:hypothetical protein [Candidatus Woesebacteria bacterium]
MIKRLVLVIFLLLLVPVSALAQNTSVQSEPADESAIFPVPRPNVNTFLGQKHDYTVVFRGNGESVVSVRVALANNTESELRNVELRLPDYIKTSELLAFQVIREGYCLRYAQPAIYSPGVPQSCEEYSEPDYFQGYGQNKYQKAVVEVVGDTLKVTLPTAIAKEKSGAFFVYMRAVGFAKKDLFGAYNFNFETLKVNESIQNLQVGISTDSDLVLKGAKGEVDYRFEDTSTSLMAAGVSEKAAASPAIDNFYNQIGYGSITKTASSLAALESYKVSGAYASTRLMLYAKEILVGAVVLLAVVVVFLLVAKVILRKGGKKVSTPDQAKEVVEPKTLQGGTFLLSFLASIVSSVLIALYTAGLLLVSRLISGAQYYDYDSQTNIWLWIIIIVASFAVYAFLILGPSIFIGIKRGVGWGFATLGLTILWLVLLVFIVGLVIFLGGIGKYEPPVPYLLEGGLGPQKAD